MISGCICWLHLYWLLTCAKTYGILHERMMHFIGTIIFFCPQLFVHRRWIIVHNMVYVYVNIAYMIILFQFSIHFFPLIFEWWTSFKWWTKQCISVEIFWEFCLLFISTHFYLLFSLCTRANPSIMQTQFHLANWNVSR